MLYGSNFESSKLGLSPKQHREQVVIVYEVEENEEGELENCRVGCPQR